MAGCSGSETAAMFSRVRYLKVRACNSGPACGLPRKEGLRFNSAEAAPLEVPKASEGSAANGHDPETKCLQKGFVFPGSELLPCSASALTPPVRGAPVSSPRGGPRPLLQTAGGARCPPPAAVRQTVPMSPVPAPEDAGGASGLGSCRKGPSSRWGRESDTRSHTAHLVALRSPSPSPGRDGQFRLPVSMAAPPLPASRCTRPSGGARPAS